jgi:nucleoside-diphosphate-sugar epimerase
MDVVIVGAHGKVGRRLVRILVARGDRVRGIIRKADQAEDVRSDGAEPVVCDLESADVDEIARSIAGADAAVFTAGAGPGSGAERKWTLDRDGAVELIDAARAQDVPRYVMLSTVGAESPPDGDDVFSVYLRAKAEADEALTASDRDWTIVRPGLLGDEPGTGRVRVDTEPFREDVTRDDVAAVLAAVLREPRSVRKILYVGQGDEPIERALAAAVAVPRAT